MSRARPVSKSRFCCYKLSVFVSLLQLSLGRLKGVDKGRENRKEVKLVGWMAGWMLRKRSGGEKEGWKGRMELCGQ